MKTVYKSGISRGLLIFIVLFLLSCFALLLALLSAWVGIVLLVIFSLFIVDTLVNTRYIIEEKNLWVRCGIFAKSRYDIDHIVEISKTDSWESAPAASLDRIRLRVSRFQSIIVSPRQQQAFIDHLLRINPNIVVKPPLSVMG